MDTSNGGQLNSERLQQVKTLIEICKKNGVVSLDVDGVKIEMVKNDDSGAVAIGFEVVEQEVEQS